MNEGRERLIAYQVAMALTKEMLRQGIITEAEYTKIEEVFAEKYGFSSHSIFRNFAQN